MKCLLSVSLATALVVAANLALSNLTQSEKPQKGISVQMAVTSNADAMPAADNNNAWIVTVTEDGKLYFGIHPVTPDSLTEEMKATPRNREQNLYIKADSRTAFANVQETLEAARVSLFNAPVLLTTQRESPKPGVVVPPRGLEVLVDSQAESSESVVVQVLRSRLRPATLKVDNREIPANSLQSRLQQLFHNNGSEKLVTLRITGSLPFGDVAQVIDTCHAAGVKVSIAPPTV